jgi:hypothetical protein
MTKDNKLKILQKVPQPPPNMKPARQDRGRDLMRGPEEIHNKLIHKQFGIVVSDQLIDWLIDFSKLIDWFYLIDWLIDWLID